MHSGFLATHLEALRNQLSVEELIMTGIAGNICVLFTANDAFTRGYKDHVPGNCKATNIKADDDNTLRQLRDVFGIRRAFS